MEKKYQIFISSTYNDLKNARLQVLNTIASMYHIPSGMELFSATNNSQWELIEKEILNSDYYLLILGHRYGSLTEEGISYTEKEYNFALANDIPIIAFIRKRDVPTRPFEREKDPILIEKLELFLNKVMKNRLCEFWSTEIELSKKISVGLTKEFQITLRPGWIRNVETIHYIGDFTKKYLENLTKMGRENVTIASYQIELKILSDFFSGIPLISIDKSRMLEFFEYRRNSYNIKKNSTIERTRSIIKTFFQWLKDENIININPLNSIPSFKVNRLPVSGIDSLSIKKLRDSCTTFRESAILETFLSTGCRLDELINLQIVNFDSVKKIIRIEKTNSFPRIIPINEITCNTLSNYLETRKDREPFLFVTERKPYRKLTRRSIQRSIGKIASYASLNTKVSPKILRHTFAQNLVDKNCPLNVIQTLLGHKEISSTKETYFSLKNSNLEVVRKYL